MSARLDAADPFINLASRYWAATNSEPSPDLFGAALGAWYAASRESWRELDRAMAETSPTTLAGLVAALRVLRADLDNVERPIWVNIIDSAIRLLDTNSAAGRPIVEAVVEDLITGLDLADADSEDLEDEGDAEPEVYDAGTVVAEGAWIRLDEV